MEDPFHFFRIINRFPESIHCVGCIIKRENMLRRNLLWVIAGRVKDVVVDLREDSPSFGTHFTVELSGDNRKILFIPKGVAHGFLALENQTIFSYKCDEYYNPESEGGIIYNDPYLNIDWGISPSKLILSERDLRLPEFKEIFK